MITDEVCPRCGERVGVLITDDEQLETVLRPLRAYPALERTLDERPLPWGSSPDFVCTSCAYWWYQHDPYPRWPESAALDAIDTQEYEWQVGRIRSRLRMTLPVCHELRTLSPDDIEVAQYACELMLDGLLVSPEQGVDPVDSGMDRLIVPQDHADLVRLLEKANDVCRSVRAVRPGAAGGPDTSRSVAAYRSFLAELLAAGAPGEDPPVDWLRGYLAELDEDAGITDSVPEVDQPSDDERLAALLRAGTGEEPGPDTSWSGIERIAERIFPWSVHREWARDAWRALGRVGFTRYDNEVERARAACRLMCLDVIRQEFLVRVEDSGMPGYWGIDPSALTGDAVQGVHPVVLGILAGCDGAEIGEEPAGPDDDHWLSEVVHALVRVHLQDTADTLRRAQGTAVVFSSLYASEQPEVRYPLSREAVVLVADHDDAGNKIVTYEWISEGMAVG